MKGLRVRARRKAIPLIVGGYAVEHVFKVESDRLVAIYVLAGKSRVYKGPEPRTDAVRAGVSSIREPVNSPPETGICDFIVLLKTRGLSIYLRRDYSALTTRLRKRI